jgi:hypothetical protein
MLVRHDEEQGALYTRFGMLAGGPGASAPPVDTIQRLPMLMPLLVGLTDSEIQSIYRVVAQSSNGVEDGRDVLEEVGPAGLAIYQEPLLPNLHIEPVHRDAQLTASSGGLASRDHGNAGLQSFGIGGWY